MSFLFETNLILLLQTSTDCGYFDDVIKAYHRLLDLKDKYTDIDVLRILRNACLNNLKYSNDRTMFNLKNKVLELFGRISSAVSKISLF